MEEGSTVGLEHVLAEIQDHQLRDTEGWWNLLSAGIQDVPIAAVFTGFVGDGKSAGLERFQITINGPWGAVQGVG